MQSFVEWFVHWLKLSPYIAPALAAGIIDYMTQVRMGSIQGTILGGLAHVTTAIYFGWLALQIASLFTPGLLAHGHLGADEVPLFYTVTISLAGLVGGRVSELLIFVLRSYLRK